IDLVFSPTHSSVQRQIRQWRKDHRIAPNQFSIAALDSADHWVKQMLHTRTPAESEINRNNRVLWDGALRCGLHPRLYQLDTYAPGTWPTALSDKRSSVTAMLLPAMLEPQNPLALVPDARVTSVLIDSTADGKTACGVRFVAKVPWSAPGVLPDPLRLHMRPGDTLDVQAKRVVLCAGALGSAALLLEARIPNPAIGRGIVGHVAVPIIGVFDDTIDAASGTPATVFVDDFA